METNRKLMKNHKVSLIVLDYYSMRETFAYLRQFWEQEDSRIEYQYIIVDNSHQTDIVNYCKTENMAIAKEQFVDHHKVKHHCYCIETDNRMVHWIISGKNLGYAKGNNLGAVFAKRFSPDYLIFSNNDISFPQKIEWEQMVEPLMSNHRCAVVGPRVVGLDGYEQNPHVIKKWYEYLFLQPLHFFLPEGMKRKVLTDLYPENKAGEVDWVSGCFFVADANAFFEVCGFDEHTFLYGEEIILSERFRQKGKIIYYSPQIEICHHNSKIVNSKYTHYDKMWFTFDSMSYYLRKYRKVPMVVIFLAKGICAMNILVKKIMINL